MNVFKFLDDTIRGTILLIVDFLATTGTLLVHPLAGSKRLHRRRLADETNKISPTTYLAIAVGIAAALTPIINDLYPDEGRIEGFFTATARFITTGAASGMGPFIAGALAGTLLLIIFLHGVAWAARIGRQRKERYLATAEYDFGASFIFISLALIFWGLAATDMEMEKSRTIPMLLAAFVLYQIAILLVFFSTMKLIVHAIPVKILIAIKASAARYSHLLFQAKFKRAARLNRYYRDKWLTLRVSGNTVIDWLVSRLIFAALFLFALAVSIAIVVGTIGGASLISSWVRDQEAPPKPLEIIDLECALDESVAYASAVAWNRSDRPLVRWRSDLRLILTGRDSYQSPWVTLRLPWQPGPAGGEALPEVLTPGAIVRIDGPILLNARGRLAVAGLRERRCRLEGDRDLMTPTAYSVDFDLETFLRGLDD